VVINVEIFEQAVERARSLGYTTKEIQEQLRFMLRQLDDDDDDDDLIDLDDLDLDEDEDDDLNDDEGDEQ
jgi:hypothetical protein